MLEAVVLAFGLAMDATAVAAARGLATRARSARVGAAAADGISARDAADGSGISARDAADGGGISTRGGADGGMSSRDGAGGMSAGGDGISARAGAADGGILARDDAKGAVDLRRRELILLPLLFGMFQAGMAALGWALGAWGGRLVAAWDHWIAFALLSLVGAKMIIEAVRGGDEAYARVGGLGLYLVLAFATSIDAAAAGVTLPLVAVAPWISLLLIGMITAACSLVGYVAGRAIGGKKLEIAGGVILIGLGVRILVEHL
jgi:putative Mn2+ efflux pump MntP